jgi:DNA-binding LytR/AlgR family response regulator
MRCICIIEDQHWSDTLVEFIQQTPSLELVCQYRNPPEVMANFPNNQIDLMFIDTHLSYLSGIEMARKLHFIPQTIFISHDKNNAFDAFELKATDYLLKPFTYERFIQSVQAAAAKEKPQQAAIKVNTNNVFSQFLWVKSDYHYIRITLESILYIEGLKDYMKLYIKGKDKPVLTLGSLKKIEERLPPCQFQRIHRSYIVSINNVESVQRNLVKIGNAKISIGEHYKSRFFQNVIENDLI